MDQKQLQQLRAQLQITAQLNTCTTTNTKEIDNASGIDSKAAGAPESIFQSNPLHSMSYWKACPETPHHFYMQCPLSDFNNHQLPMALLAQERDNYIQLKMQTHLRRLRNSYKTANLPEDQKEKLELMQHYLFLNSRQKFVRDNFYNSFCAFTSGSPFKKRDLDAIIRLKVLSKQERKKGYVIRGISYNDFLWPKGAEFTPETPFTPLPRYVIRNRQKDNPDIDLKQTLPVVKSVLSVSASLIVASHAYDFFTKMRHQYQNTHAIAQCLNKRSIHIEIMKQQALLDELKSKLLSNLAEADEDAFTTIWKPPVFTHGIRIYPTPSLLDKSAHVHRHQIEGMSWLVHLFDHHVNAILADDTGLGKTFQIISLIAFLAEQRHISGPHLVVMPSSVVQTWKNEFEKWFPNANTIVYIGKRKRRRNMFETMISRSEFDVLLTPYSILEKDQDLISTIPWRVVVLDEAHKLKNVKTTLFSAVDANLFSEFRILTTATPFQNDLDELWALLYLVAPNEFCSLDIFKEFFKELEAIKPDSNRSARITKRLHEIIRPYILRRNKDDLDFDIPNKLEITIKCSPSNLQKAIIEKSITTNALTTTQKIHLSRKVSNSPVLFLPLNTFQSISPFYILSRSPKMRVLDQILHKLILSEHRFLIYSQWTSMMNIISIYLNWRQINFLRIDGAVLVRERMRIIDEFVKPGSLAQGMLLSTRSSAFGLNLQVADTVILFDSDYNPFVELQASARVHRLGQKNIVVIIRLLMNETGEEKILRVSRKKFVLGHQIIEAGKFNLCSTDEERSALLNEVTSKAPELTDPTDEQLDSVVARSSEELATLQYRKLPELLKEEPQYAEIDGDILAKLDQIDFDIPISESDDDEWEVVE